MNSTRLFAILLTISAIGFPVYAAEPRVFFIEPGDGAEVVAPIKLKFGIEGMEVRPAGEAMPNSGHHHLIIDGTPAPKDSVLPFSQQVQHFGKGQTETELTLPPGDHTLTLQFGDGSHHSYGPAVSQTILVHVK